MNSTASRLPRRWNVQGRDGRRAADEEGHRNVTVTNFSATESSGARFAIWFDISDRLAPRVTRCAKSVDGLTRRVDQRCGCEVSFMF
jgi:hypothetical protein